MKDAKKYLLEKGFDDAHLPVLLNDKSAYTIPEIMEEYHQYKLNNGVIDDVIDCDHPRSQRRYIGSNMLICELCGHEFS